MHGLVGIDVDVRGEWTERAPVIAHNGVRGDDDVEVREARE